MKELNINGVLIELEKKKIKNMYLKVLPPDGRIHICAPLRMSEEEIGRFVIARFDWIEKQQIKIRNRSIPHELFYESGDVLSIWGRKYNLIVNENRGENSLDLQGDNIVLSMKGTSTSLQRKKVIYTWYRKILESEIHCLLEKWEKIMGVKAESFTMRDMKTRWGTCNVRTKNICLNLQLVTKDPKCLEYVVVHELVHLLERSHNQIFKMYMDKFLPNWRIIKKELNSTITE